jgi:hypothetical protein
MLKQILIRAMVLLALLPLMNVLYVATFYKHDLEAKSKEIIELRRSADSTDLYYFGESSNTTFTPDDSIKTSISGLCSKFFPSLHLRNVNKEATHAGIYRVWLHELEESHHSIKAIIVTLNLRSFNAAWIHSPLETSLQEGLVFARPRPALWNRFSLALQAFDNKTEQEREDDMLQDWKTRDLNFPYPVNYNTVRQWDDAMANGGHLKPDGTWDMEKIILSCHYIKAYALSLDHRNPRVKDLDAIKAWCGSRGIRLYLNLMAENVRYADSLVGKDLVFLMRRNRDFLMTRYNRDNCRVIDNLELVPSNEFIDQNWTTEHYRYKGRMIIAKHVAEELKKDFNKEFVNAY